MLLTHENATPVVDELLAETDLLQPNPCEEMLSRLKAAQEGAPGGRYADAIHGTLALLLIRQVGKVQNHVEILVLFARLPT